MNEVYLGLLGLEYYTQESSPGMQTSLSADVKQFVESLGMQVTVKQGGRLSVGMQGDICVVRLPLTVGPDDKKQLLGDVLSLRRRLS